MFHPLMRVWIEICAIKVWFFKNDWFHPLMRVWIEIMSVIGKDTYHCRFTLL